MISSNESLQMETCFFLYLLHVEVASLVSAIHGKLSVTSHFVLMGTLFMAQ